jgi:hypothetical protein
VVNKKRRAKRARARQRGRYDLRHCYRERDLPVEHIGIASIEDPFPPAGYLDAEGNFSASARLAPAQHRDGTIAEGAPGWTPPRRPKTTVFVSLKDDPIGRMHSQHQIDEAQYRAARAFQEAADQATLGAVRAVNLTKTRVSGGIAPDPLTPSRQKAMKWLRVAEDALMHRHGAEGLALTRAVLVERQSVEQTALLRGAETDREVWFWSRLFRKCLDVLALAFGFASSTRRSVRPNGHAQQDPELDPGRHADLADLMDLRLRRGRPSGTAEFQDASRLRSKVQLSINPIRGAFFLRR